jgi:heme/copper-type cytochrome/quinol oxidase subunit 4
MSDISENPKVEQAIAAATVPVDPSVVEGNIEMHRARLDDQSQTLEEAHAHVSPDYTMVFGRRINANIYVVVFGALSIITALEVALAEILPSDWLIRTLLLVGLSLVKVVLVMYFYMHLKDDNRIFAAAVIIPLIISLVSVMFLLAVPSSGY